MAPPTADELVDLHQRYLRRLYADSLEAWVRLDLTMPQLRLLYVLVNDGPHGAGALARRLGLAPSSVTGLVDRLVERGLARRDEDPRDRRVVRAAATTFGQELLETLVAQRREQLLRLFGGLSFDEQADLARVLRALLRVAAEPG
ncbi:MAG TPA: MarR family transcriptional regulator [Chloroflexota bacterium]